MKNTWHIPVFFLLFGCLIGKTGAFAQEVSASVDSPHVLIGEEIKYALEVSTDSLVPIRFPEGQTFLPLEVLEAYPADSTHTDNRFTVVKRYGLTQFDSGRYFIPQQRVFINDKPFLTDTLWVEIADVVVDTTQQKMYDIKAATAVPSPPTRWPFYVLIALAVLVVLGLLIYGWIWRKRKKAEAEKQLPPYEEALSALSILDQSGYLEKAQIKDYYSSLTEIVKRYLDREVDETALESTTDELLERLQLLKDSGKLDVDPENVRQLDDILHRADLIKFAKMQTATHQAQSDRTTLEQIINQTHESIPEPTEEERLRDERYRQEQERKKKRRKVKLVTGIVAACLFWIWAASSIFFGFDKVQETLFGNETKSLLENKWVKSEYGNPAIILEAPEVLVRVDTTQGSALPLLAGDNIFSMGRVQKKLFVLAGTTKLPEEAEVDLEQVLNEQLDLLEREGATNMFVNDQPFQTEKGLTGIHASGEFNVRVGKNKYKKEKSEFDILIFSQEGGIQELMIVREKDDLYAQQIKERILRSVEVQIPK